MDVGFVGLGAMGLPMVRHLITAGHRVHVSSRSRPPIDAALAAGAASADDLAGLATKSEVIFLCVPFADDVTEVIRGLEASLRPGTVVIDCSTIGPAAEPLHRDIVTARGAHYLDAPVSGGPAAAQAGTLAIYAGGDADIVESVRPVLEAFSSRIVPTGPTGSGQTMKMCNNLIHAAQMVAVSEAFALVERAGLDPSTLREVVMHSTGNCTAVRERVPIEGVIPTSPASNGWQGFSTEWMKKEMDMVLGFAASMDFPLVSTTVFRRLLDFASEAGYGEQDFSAVGRLYRESTADADALDWCARVNASLVS